MKSMFVAVCVVACFGVILAADDRMPRNDKFLEDLATCKKKVEATDDDVKVVIGRQKLVTKQAQCLMACIKKASGALTADNKVDMVKAKAMLEPMKSQSEEMYNKSIKMLETCKAQETAEADECVAAKKFSDCMIEQRSKA